VIAIALTITSALYLGLAVATIGVLGPASATSVPLAALLGRAVGTAGPAVAAVAAVVLTLGAVNAYVTGAEMMARQLLVREAAAGAETMARQPAGREAASEVDRARSPGFLAMIGVAGAVLITLNGFGLASVAALVVAPTALFLTVYLACMLAAARVLRRPLRRIAVVAALAVAIMLAYCGWALAIPAIVTLAAAVAARRGRACLVAPSTSQCPLNYLRSCTPL
jgi:amino acid efflux transporter